MTEKKRLDARTYRMLLSPQAEEVRNPGNARHSKGENRLSQSDGRKPGNSSRRKYEEGMERSFKKVEELKEMHSGKGSVGRKTGTSNLSKKRKFCSEKVLESETGECLLEDYDCLLPMSSVGIKVKETQWLENIEMAEVIDLNKENLSAPGLSSPSSAEGRSLANLSKVQSVAGVRASEIRDAPDEDHDISAIRASSGACTSQVPIDAISSSPSSKNCIFSDTWSVCSKPKRVNSDSEIQGKSSVCMGKCHPCQDASELVALIKDSQKDEAWCISFNKMTQQNSVEVERLRASPLSVDEPDPAKEGRRKYVVSNSGELIEERCHNRKQQDSLMENQKDGHHMCVKCKLSGRLLCCDAQGCNRSYHMSCLNPSLTVVPLGAWHCPPCVIKKIKLGVHSISPGMETICDFRELEDKGKQEKQYFVKYKGLAHVHNRWIPERQLLKESPGLIDKFKKKYQKNKDVNWKSEWIVPQRLLKKRSISSLIEAEHLSEQCHEAANSLCEWLVKWKGLGYEDATWELENASFLRSPGAITLISDYERRMRKAKEYSDNRTAEKVMIVESCIHTLRQLLEATKGSLPEVTELPGITPIGQDNECLPFVNKIFESWYKCHNAFVIDDKDRILKTTKWFILSLLPYVSLPSLIISTSPNIIQLEAEFMRLDPSMNVILYAGNKNVRSNIRMLEFYEESGCVMFEVLLSTPKAVIEDLDSLECIGRWGAIVVDLQVSRMWQHLEKIRTLSSDFKLLLASGQMKESVPEYSSILSFLGAENVVGLDQKDNVGALPILKEKLLQFVAYECKTDVSKFLEYWVPVPLSDVQLEQYCCTLVENSMSLQSYLKRDPVGALSNVLFSVIKCCEHPYLLSPELQSTLTRDLPAPEYMDVGINASGKLKFLDRILSEMKNKGKRVLILFQSVVGSEKISNGDILDDFLRKRFGNKSYKRIDGRLVKEKRDAALNMFNNIEEGRFALLLEKRACHSCIKLSSVDAVIIFGSDWNPLNDIRALLKIDFNSSSEHLKVFRLYSPCTVEEKVLMMVNQDSTALDSILQNISPATIHTLLTWGAVNLFRKLDEFHNHNNSSTTSEASLYEVEINDVVSEVLAEVHGDIGTKKASKPLLTKVQYSGTTYIRNSSLVGEAEMQVKDDDAPPIFFWCKLLEGRSDQWRYLSEPSQRIRKKKKHFDEYEKRKKFEKDETRKKCQKSANSFVKPISLKTWHEDLKGKVIFQEKEIDFASSISSSCRETPLDSVAPSKGGAGNSMKCIVTSDTTSSASCAASELADLHVDESEGSGNLHDDQRALHGLFQLEMSGLCHTLQLPDNVKVMAEMLLEHIINDHHVNREPKWTLQAFLISVCWRAASLTRYNINHEESLLVAKNLLGFECKEQQAEFVYSKLLQMKNRVSYGVCLPENSTESNSQERQTMAKTNQLLAKNLEERAEETRERAISCNYLTEQVLDEQLQVYGGDREYALQQGDNVIHTFKECCKRVEQVCSGRVEKILKKQKEEVVRFNKLREELTANVKNKHGSEVCLARKLDKLLVHIIKCYKTLVDKQQEARREEKRIKARLLQEAKAGSLGESFDELPLSETGFDLEYMRISSEQLGAGDDLQDIVPTSGTSCGRPCVDTMMSGPTESIALMEVSRASGVVDSHNDKLDNVLSGREKTNELIQHGLVRDEEGVCVASSKQNHVGLSSPRHNESFLTHEVSVAGHETASGSVVDSVDTPHQNVPSSQVEHDLTITVSLPIEPSQLAAPGAIVKDVFQSHEGHNCSHQVKESMLQSVDCCQQSNPSEGHQVQLETRRADPERPEVIPESSYPPQTYPVNATQSLQSSKADPLRNEMDKILRQKEIAIRMNDEEKKRLNSELERKIEGVIREHNNLVQAEDVRLQQTLRTLDMNHFKVYLNLLLAETYRCKSYTPIPPLQARQGVSPAPHLVPQSSRIPAPPLCQVVHHSFELFSGDSSRSDHLPVIPRTTLQVDAELRAPPLQTYRPSNSAVAIHSSSISATRLLTETDGSSRPDTKNLVHAHSYTSSDDAWVACSEGQGSSRRPCPAVDGHTTGEGTVICLSDDE